MKLKEKQQLLWDIYYADPTLENRNKLVESYIPLVERVAQNTVKKLTNEVDSGDLFSYGVFGLMDAIEKFDPSMGVQFSTYAYRRVYGAIIDELRSFDRVPRQLRNHAKKTKQYIEEMESERRHISDEEIADHLGVTVERHRRFLASIPQMASLDFAVTDESTDDEVPYSEVIEPYEPSGLDEEQINYLRDRLSAALESLGEKESALMWLYYYEDITLREVGEQLSITESRASQMHAKALQTIYQSIVL